MPNRSPLPLNATRQQLRERLVTTEMSCDAYLDAVKATAGIVRTQREERLELRRQNEARLVRVTQLEIVVKQLREQLLEALQDKHRIDELHDLEVERRAQCKRCIANMIKEVQIDSEWDDANAKAKAAEEFAKFDDLC